MPVVTVRLWEGRNEDEKQAVTKGITDVLCKEIGVKPEATVIIFEEVSKGNWATGGVLWSVREKDTNRKPGRL